MNPNHSVPPPPVEVCPHPSGGYTHRHPDGETIVLKSGTVISSRYIYKGFWHLKRNAVEALKKLKPIINKSDSIQPSKEDQSSCLPPVPTFARPRRKQSQQLLLGSVSGDERHSNGSCVATA